MCHLCTVWIRKNCSPKAIEGLIDMAGEATMTPVMKRHFEGIYRKPFDDITHEDFKKQVAVDMSYDLVGDDPRDKEARLFDLCDKFLLLYLRWPDEFLSDDAMRQFLLKVRADHQVWQSQN